MTGGTSGLAVAALALTILLASALARLVAFILTRTYMSVQYLDFLKIHC
jgi:hypothetical protein